MSKPAIPAGAADTAAAATTIRKAQAEAQAAAAARRAEAERQDSLTLTRTPSGPASRPLVPSAASTAATPNEIAAILAGEARERRERPMQVSERVSLSPAPATPEERTYTVTIKPARTLGGRRKRTTRRKSRKSRKARKAIKSYRKRTHRQRRN